MLDPATVPDVADNETIARYIFQSSHIRSSDGTVKPNAFMPPDNNLECSVTRHLQTTESERWQIGDALAQERLGTLYGRADLGVSQCTIQQLSVVKQPIASNPNHANISNWPGDKALRKIIAQELAAAAALRIR